MDTQRQYACILGGDPGESEQEDSGTNVHTLELQELLTQFEDVFQAPVLGTFNELTYMPLPSYLFNP